MDQYQYPATPPPYHINQYDNAYPDPNQHNQYDYDYNFPSNNYNSRIDPNEQDPYYNEGGAPPIHKNDGGFPPHREETFYHMSFWVNYFRYIPHINLTFNRVNDTFNPLSPIYQESLGLIGCVPAALLLLTLVALLLYLLTRCCDHKARSRGSITCCKVACVLCSLLGLGVISISIWGSQEVHNGINSALVHSFTPINDNLISLTTTTQTLISHVRRNLEPHISLFQEAVLNQDISNVTVKHYLLDKLRYMHSNISDVLLINVEDIGAKMQSTVFEDLTQAIDLAEMIRWAVTIIVAAVLMIVVLLLVIGAVAHSRPTLITFSVLGLLSLIISYGLTAIYLVSAVGLSDWCVNPGGVALENWLGRVYSRSVAHYYLHCSDMDRSSPFTQHLSRAQQSAESILNSVQEVMKIADQYYPREMVHPRLDQVSGSIDQSQRSLATIAALLECQPQYHHFMIMVHHMCTTSMNGLVYLLLSAFGSAIFFTLLVWLSSHTWIYLNSKSDACSVEETDPFLPGGSGAGGVIRPGGGTNGGGGGQGSRGGTLNSMGGGGRGARHSHTPPQTPPFPGTLNGRYNHPPPNHSVPSNHYASHTLGHKREGGMNGAQGGNQQHHHHHHTATMPRGDPHGHSHSHSHGQMPPPVGPNQGQYATLSKQCKTLESNDFY